MTLTDLLSRLRQLDEEMTPGPWEFSGATISQDREPWGDVVSMEGHVGWSGCSHFLAIREPDATGIAILRNLLPAFTDVVERADLLRTTLYPRDIFAGASCCEDDNCEHDSGVRLLRRLDNALARLTEAADEDALRSFGGQG